jgi:glycosyltransferase involved in cell wall biosynthesis
MQGLTVRRLVGNRFTYYPQMPFALRRELAAEPADVVVDLLNKLPFFSPLVTDTPCCAIAHHLFGRTAFDQVPFPIAVATALAEKLIPVVYRDTPMLAISESTRVDLIARGIPGKNVVVVPPGIDETAYRCGPLAGRQPLVVWIGRLEHYKRADVMVEAFVEIRRQVPAARLTVIGAGQARGALERLVRERGLRDAVEFTGYISDERKIEYLQRAALLVNTSVKEGFGLTVIEANACGAATVSTDVPGLRDSIRDGETGVLVPFDDVAALARAAVRVLTDDEFRARLVANGLAWAATFSWERAADATEDLIERAIAGAPGRA